MLLGKRIERFGKGNAFEESHNEIPRITVRTIGVIQFQKHILHGKDLDIVVANEVSGVNLSAYAFQDFGKRLFDQLLSQPDVRFFRIEFALCSLPESTSSFSKIVTRISRFLSMRWRGSHGGNVFRVTVGVDILPCRVRQSARRAARPRTADADRPVSLPCKRKSARRQPRETQ